MVPPYAESIPDVFIIRYNSSPVGVLCRNKNAVLRIALRVRNIILLGNACLEKGVNRTNRVGFIGDYILYTVGAIKRGAQLHQLTVICRAVFLIFIRNILGKPGYRVYIIAFTTIGPKTCLQFRIEGYFFYLYRILVDNSWFSGR